MLFVRRVPSRARPHCVHGADTYAPYLSLQRNVLSQAVFHTPAKRAKGVLSISCFCFHMHVFRTMFSMHDAYVPWHTLPAF